MSRKGRKKFDWGSVKYATCQPNNSFQTGTGRNDLGRIASHKGNTKIMIIPALDIFKEDWVHSLAPPRRFRDLCTHKLLNFS
ncbi:hypothetical protein F0562_036103 [Nyssa sinensis]|uniref:Uncharacterized protein n=1 Tax=Nyssa sinensis TaxID=561372 RepID=A0A5J5AEV8_9ASTE|nr:hypothetical protein F0562_036103 [Nyssa sinensis]